MTKEQAEEIVLDLIQAVRNYERADRATLKYYREDYEALRDRIIAALTDDYKQEQP